MKICINALQNSPQTNAYFIAHLFRERKKKKKKIKRTQHFFFSFAKNASSQQTTFFTHSSIIFLFVNVCVCEWAIVFVRNSLFLQTILFFIAKFPRVFRDIYWHPLVLLEPIYIQHIGDL